MEEPEYSFDQVRRALEKVVAERPDYVYKRPWGDRCMYAWEGQPSCGVGAMAYELGPEVFAKFAALDPVEPEDCSAHMDHVNLGGCLMDSRTLAFLTSFQSFQDSRKPWGKSLAEAEKGDRYAVVHRAWRENKEIDSEGDED